MNSPLRTEELGENPAATIPDKETDTRLEAEVQAAFPEGRNTVLQSNGLLGSAMKWLAEVFVDVG